MVAVAPTLTFLSTRRECLLRAGKAAALVALPSFAAPAQAGYNIFTSVYTVSKADLQAQANARFPLRMGSAQLMVLALTEPVLSLDTEHNRVAVSCKLSIASPLTQPGHAAGVLNFSSALKYNAANRSVLMDQPSTDHFDLELLSEQSAALLTRMGRLITAQALQDVPIYTFKPEQLKYGPKTFEPTHIKVVEDGIAVSVK